MEGPKKDLTGILHQPSETLPTLEIPSEKVEEFISLDQLGLAEPQEPTVNQTAPKTTPEPEKETVILQPEPNPEPQPFLETLQIYAENAQETVSEAAVFFPFHLYLSGIFGPFERDKLLRYITENEIGLSSSDLDLQIKSGRVFFPRISEYVGVKIIQELRDSGLDFKLIPSGHTAIPSGQSSS